MMNNTLMWLLLRQNLLFIQTPFRSESLMLVNVEVADGTGVWSKKSFDICGLLSKLSIDMYKNN